jgi:hypothetical protein
LDRLRADLIAGELDAWWQHYANGDWHQIPPAHWRGEGVLESGIKQGWIVGGGMWSMFAGLPGVPSSEEAHFCRIYAARPRPSKRAQPPKRRKRPVLDILEPVAKELWPPDGKPPDEISNDAALILFNEKLDRRFGRHFLRHDPNGVRDPTSLLRVMGRRPR